MTPQMILFVGIVTGGIGLLSGILLFYSHYLKIKHALETRIIQAEKELDEDIREIPVEELLQTKAGIELKNYPIKDKAGRIILSIVRELENERRTSDVLISNNVIYHVSLGILFGIAIKIATFLGFLDRIGILSTDMHKRQSVHEKESG